MNKVIRLAGAMLVAMASATAHAANLPLDLECSDSGNPAKEAARIKTAAPGVVTRESKHVLKVLAGGKTLSFTDEPPYDDPYGNMRYEFCARKEGFILVRAEDIYLSTGKLINEATGAVTDGGERVTLSPDRRAYFTSSQPDGLDGSVWAIHALDGRKSWEGYSFIPHPVKAGHMAATLSDERWEANGELSAQATCFYGKSAPWRVKLVKSDGAWDWRPRRTCPDA
ncbi:hypothetical protein IV454_19085 [Massilia antarctica]|uniref:Secreted protein n=1 Tax=Massilia antarctica TaxID=2765360 RepID=A0AA49A5P3_9BURK|nr:hypothetical protein [Massilia antarctica]QPI47688.1 hypothetical protein IV454_19085 [Massilia antarctica]